MPPPLKSEKADAPDRSFGLQKAVRCGGGTEHLIANVRLAAQAHSVPVNRRGRSMSKRETIRRLLWGDLLKVLRVRYGNTRTSCSEH